MIHPRNEIDKVYVARVKGVANKDNLRPLTRGLEIDGKKTKPAVYEKFSKWIQSKTVLWCS